MPKNLTAWQKLARLARKHDLPSRGLGADEIAEMLIRNCRLSQEDKRLLAGICNQLGIDIPEEEEHGR